VLSLIAVVSLGFGGLQEYKLLGVNETKASQGSDGGVQIVRSTAASFKVHRTSLTVELRGGTLCIYDKAVDGSHAISTKPVLVT